MKRPISKFLMPLSAWTVAFSAATVLAQPTGQWNFKTANPLAAVVGSPLQYTDGVGGATQLGSALGTTTSFGIPDIGGTPVQVLRFPSCTNGTMGYNMPSPTVSNGGGSRINDYTVIFDLLYPSSANAQIRPLMEADGGFFTPDTDLIINGANAFGELGGTLVGSIQANTWYRIGISANADANEIDFYINGVLAGSQAYGNIDDKYSLDGNAAKIFGSAGATATVGYVNSIQVRDVALNPGQMQALGGPSATGIPQIIPPVPSFIQSRTPGLGALRVQPQPGVDVIVNQGDTILDNNSFSLALDGSLLNIAVTPNGSTTAVDATVTNILAPDTIHTLKLVYSDSVAGLKTNSWTFTVQHFQVVNLPPPFAFEDFDSVAEGSLPTGWVATNATTIVHDSYDLTDPKSNAYLDWVVINTNTLHIAKGGDPLLVPPIEVNGVMLTAMADNQLAYAESDSRDGSQVQVLFSPDFDCTGKTNVFLSFHSIYQQNQDSMGAVEYSIDQGATWLPAMYMLDAVDSGGDIRYLPDGVTIDAVKTMTNAQTDTAYSQPYGYYIAAPITQALAPFISPRTNDDNIESIRVEVLRLAGADKQSHVRLRFLQTGTGSWWFAIDSVGLYSINTPVITTPPQNVTANAGGSATFTVSALGGPFTYQWNYNGNPILNQTGATLTLNNVGPANAGPYTVTVRNSSGPTISAAAILTVVDLPQFTTQPLGLITSAGNPSASLTVATVGRQPMAYQWLLNGLPVSGATAASLVFSPVSAANAGNYVVVAQNVTGSTTSTVARVTVASGAITNNLVCHISFDGDYADSSGRGNDAVPIGGPSLVPGVIGQAMQFTTSPDGADIEYATLGTPSDLLFADLQDFAISFWAKNAGAQSDDLPWISNKNWDSSGNLGWGIFMQGGGKTRVNLTSSPNVGKYDTGGVGPVIRDGNWHHIVATFARGSVGYTIIDGNLIDARVCLTPAIDTVSASENINIGQDGRGTYTDGGGVNVTNAVIDDLGIWTRAISPDEAKAIYAAGLAGKDLSKAFTKVALHVAVVGSNLQITWTGSPSLKLQRTASLSPAVWVDVPNTLGAGSASVSLTTGAGFFRLSQ